MDFWDVFGAMFWMLLLNVVLGTVISVVAGQCANDKHIGKMIGAAWHIVTGIVLFNIGLAASLTGCLGFRDIKECAYMVCGSLVFFGGWVDMAIPLCAKYLQHETWKINLMAELTKDKPSKGA